MAEFIGDRRKRRDRRGTTREADSGVLELSFSAPVPGTIQAALVESSATGFRASYDAKALEPGLQVRYRRDGASGDARVIWTHMLDGRRVSGFLLL